MTWSNFVQHMYRWRAVVDSAMNLRIARTWGICWQAEELLAYEEVLCSMKIDGFHELAIKADTAFGVLSTFYETPCSSQMASLTRMDKLTGKHRPFSGIVCSCDRNLETRGLTSICIGSTTCFKWPAGFKSGYERQQKLHSLFTQLGWNLVS